jgi:hypothetical protein
MGQFKLVQVYKSKTEEPSRYQLTYDTQILVESCTFSEGITQVEKLIKPGDTYQEKEVDAALTPEQNYASFVRNRELDRLFDKGILR